MTKAMTGHDSQGTNEDMLAPWYPDEITTAKLKPRIMIHITHMK